jgi:serine/threonine protein kinase/superfamily II DNA or RNA helicase
MINCPRCKKKCLVDEKRCNRCGASLPLSSATNNDNLSKSDGEYSIGNYRIVSQLAVGGFGTTQVARRENKEYLLKHVGLQNGSDTASIANIFHRECKILAGLKHHGLPQIAEYDVHENSLLLSLNLCSGISLLEFIYPEAKPDAMIYPTGGQVLPDFDRIARWCTQLLDILAFLHGQKPFPIIHRNLNPSTIWLTKPGEDIQLLDFGIQNSFRAITANTTAWHAAPSCENFAEPELLGDRWADHQVDIYAFGRVLDFMLTGTIPAKRGGAPIFPNTGSILNPETAMLIAGIITRCCYTLPEDRYQNVAEIKSDLARLHSETMPHGDGCMQCACGHLNRASARFCEHCAKRIHNEADSIGSVGSIPIRISYDEDRHTRLLMRYHNRHFAPFGRFKIQTSLDEVQLDPGFDELISLDALPMVEKLPHQKEAALKALKQMRGRALLADEVGLGKTIEAGIILKELLLRRLTSRVLIFCPVQLLSQWQNELYERFDEVFLIMGRDIDTSLAWHCPHLIAPYEIARQQFHIAEMLRQRYDLLILDEAHCLNYPDNWRILKTMKNLQKKYFLLLSATPMHNSLEELYNIITLLRPGHFNDLDSFRDQFIDANDPTCIRDIDTLRTSLMSVMIRNIRRKVSIDFPKRNASLVELPMQQDAAEFYKRFREFYQSRLAHITNRRFLLQMGEIAERLCSSPGAFREPINRLKRDRYAQKQLGQEFVRVLEDFAARYPSSLIEPKIRATVKSLQEFTSKGQKVLVFSQFNETARYLYRRVCETDLQERCILYDELDPIELRLQSLRNFQDSHAGVLFCPGEASEGLNLQFANVMINFDLPWDPMKLEQRIGRIQRIGGKQDVIIINLVLKETIEEDILRICQNKIRMFSDVIGQVEEILGNLRDEDDFRTMICNLYLDRHEENDEGKTISPEEHLTEALDEAVEKSSDLEKSNLLNSICFDLSTSEDEE